MIRKDLDEDTILVAHRGHRMSDVIEFWEEINKIYRDGFIFENPKTPREVPTMPIVENLKFVRKVSDFERLTKKVELLEYAEKNDIDVPEDKQVNPAMIRKAIKDILAEKE